MTSEFSVNSTGERTIDHKAVSESVVQWIANTAFAKTCIRDEIQKPIGRPLSVRLPQHLQEMLGVFNGVIGMLGNGSLVHWDTGLVIAEKERLYPCADLPLTQDDPKTEEMVAS